MPGAIAIGDILETQGYNQTVMFGADADYGGLTTFYKTHDDFNIFDYKVAKEKELIPEDYFQWWGFEDVQDELQSNSNFCNDEFISKKKDSIYTL